MTPADGLLVLALDAPRSVRAGGSANLTLVARNAGAQPLVLYLRGRVPAFDFVVRDAAGTVVWRRLHDQVVPAIAQVVTIAPGRQLVFRDTWNLRAQSGAPVPAGLYRVMGFLLRDEPEPFASPAAELTVLPPS